TPLLWAAKNGHEVVKPLWSRENVIPDTADKDGRTPLLWAAGNGREDTVKTLLQREDSLPTFRIKTVEHLSPRQLNMITGTGLPSLMPHHSYTLDILSVQKSGVLPQHLSSQAAAIYNRLLLPFHFRLLGVSPTTYSTKTEYHICCDCS
ncbi:hypothetical protein B9Z19DRAFT_986824, partial [Tuber borchii]